MTLEKKVSDQRVELDNVKKKSDEHDECQSGIAGPVNRDKGKKIQKASDEITREEFDDIPPKVPYLSLKSKEWVL